MNIIKKDVRKSMEVDAFLYRKGLNLLGDLPLIGDHIDATVVIAGSALMRYGSECLKLQEGDIYFVTPGTMTIFEDYQDLNTIHIALIPDETVLQHMPKEARVLHLSAREYLPFFRENVEILEQYYSRNPLTKTDFIEFLVQTMGILLSDLFWENADQFCCYEQNELVQEAYRYISECYTEEITMDTLTKKYFVSNSYLTRLFKKYANIAPMETVLRFRILAASELLLRSRESISDIAIKVGYSSLLAFQKAFYRRNGCSPSDFRQKYTEDYVNARFIYVNHKIQYISRIFPNKQE